MIQILDEYGLSRDDFMETMKDLQFKVEKDAVLSDQFEQIDSKVKSALTRTYNTGEHHSQALVSAMDSKKYSSSKRKVVPTQEDDWGDVGEDEDGLVPREDEDDNDDDEDVSMFVKKGKASSSSSSASRPATAKSSAIPKKSSSSSSSVNDSRRSHK